MCYLGPNILGPRCYLLSEHAKSINHEAEMAPCTVQTVIQYFSKTIWAAVRENLSSVFPTKRHSNQSPQLQRLARKLKFRVKQA